MLKLERLSGPVWINPYAVQSIEPNPNGDGCFVAVPDGSGFHVTAKADAVAHQIALLTDRNLGPIN